ncbi:MAG: MerR family transcriptional regulator [Acidimicrobiales bacterium]
MAEYRVDEVARRAGTTVRNVRAYQDRGLLPPPRREGRVALYSDAHLARLRLVGGLLERGYTLANIAELVAAWQKGQDVGALLGLEAVLGAAWSEQPVETVAVEDLARLFAGVPVDGQTLDRAIDVGIIDPVGDGRYRVRNPSALEVGSLLLRSGVPLPAVLEAARRLRDDVDDVARQFVGLVEEHVFGPLGQPLPAREVPRLAGLVEQLRPLAKQVVEVELARAMERHIRERFGEHLERSARAVGAPGGSRAVEPPE